MKYLYTKNCKTSVEEMEEAINNGKIFHAQGLEEYW